MSLAQALAKIDQFKSVPKEFTERTGFGGVFTVVVYVIIGLVLVVQFSDFMTSSYQTNVILDRHKGKLLQINLDILMYDLPCKHLKLQVFDTFGEERLKTKNDDALTYISVGPKGQATGRAYTASELEALEKNDAIETTNSEKKEELDSDWASSSDKFKHQSFDEVIAAHDYMLVNFYAEWCGHCRQFHPAWLKAADAMSDKMDFKDAEERPQKVHFLKMNCVDFQANCNKIRIDAYPTLRFYKRDGSFIAYNGKRTQEDIQSFLTKQVKESKSIVAKHHHIFTEGCQVRGTLLVPRVPGHFNLMAEPRGNLVVNPALTNVSHRVNHLSFGDKEAMRWVQRQGGLPTDMLGNISPLDGKAFTVVHFHEAPQHYLKVVSTSLPNGKTFFQMTHADRERELPRDSNKPPQARFTYDLSPMSVVLSVKKKRWYEFITALCAIIGGAYTVAELMNATVGTAFSEAVKRTRGKDL